MKQAIFLLIKVVSIYQSYFSMLKIAESLHRLFLFKNIKFWEQILLLTCMF